MNVRSVITHEEMVGRIIATWGRASHEQRLAGARWYPTAGAMVRLIGQDTNTDPERVTYVMSALSPRNPWLWNVADCYAFCVAAKSGEPRPTATTFERNRATAWAILTEPSIRPWTTAAPKVNAFVHAIMGDRMSVVVDTWAYRVATGHEARPGWGSNASRYESLKLAYIEAATTLGHDPRDVQAVTWLVAQAEGLTSNRRGRTDLSTKRTTAPFVIAMLAGLAS